MEQGHDLLKALVVRNSQGEIVSASQAIEERKFSQCRNAEAKPVLELTATEERKSSQSRMAAALSLLSSSQDQISPFSENNLGIECNECRVPIRHDSYNSTGLCSQCQNRILAPNRQDNTLATMDLSQFTPPPSAQGANNENMPPYQSGFRAMANLQDIADFDTEHPYIPKPKLVALQGSKWNSENIVRFQHLCDSHAIRPIFTFEEVCPGGYSAKVVFGQTKLETSEVHAGKRQAKEALCKLAIAHLPAPVKQAGIKRKSSEIANGGSVVDRSENWVGILHQNAQQNKAFEPLYTKYATTESKPVRFGCTISIVGGPLTPFGRDLGPFPSKSDAKVAAAKAAVEWLRSAGLLEQTPAKRQKNKSPSPEGVSPGNTGLTQKLGGFNMELDSAASLPELVHNSIASLGFRQPRWIIQPVKTTSSGESISGPAVMFDVAAYFNEEDVAVEPRLAGPIGQVERIYGKKKAREECCRKVLPLLEDIQRSRMT